MTHGDAVNPIPGDQDSRSRTSCTRSSTLSPESVVRAANRQFYDAVADRYEEIDGRRSTDLEAWLLGKLRSLRRRAPGPRLLDLGTGSGLVARCAEGVFDPRVGADLSPRILALNRRAFDWGVAADVNDLPFADASFDAVTCFAVLHHLYGFEGLVSEVARVLAPGGVFYSDHDMDAAFNRRFRLPLAIYRRVHNARAKYRRASGQITAELYRLTEWQESGLDTVSLVRSCERTGFMVEASFHWHGLSPITDRLFGLRARPRGWAPLLSILAAKREF